ncbi:hypothetical protein QA637_29615 (plasmid) [Sinorhizobium terangae]|nr:hypothetical protein [Sinorhizobium terangae]WFU51652.1 hypothetical protein QA637_29615 [Sinorhizobium terangae]
MLADPQHERHDDLVKWWGSDQFDPNHIDKPAIEQALRALAKNGPEKSAPKHSASAAAHAGGLLNWLRQLLRLVLVCLFGGANPHAA